MEHSFDIDIAKIYGIPSAILLKNLYFWIEKNRANEKNYYDGYYWTYNSKKAFAELFPYMTARQIDYALQKLIDDGLIITGNYNKVAYDRTLWYAITKKGYSILQKCEMDITKTHNANNENVTPIPNNKPNSFSNEKHIEKEKEEKENDVLTEFETLWKMYPRKLGKPKALKAYIKARKNGTTYEQVKQGIENYLAEIKAKKTAAEYIKHGSTWFNGECWNDEYNTTVSTTPQYQQPKQSETDDFMAKLKSMYHAN